MVIGTGDNDIKERLSIAYVTAVAARAGCQLMEVHVDRNRIDATISAIAGTRVKIDLQLKATSADILDDEYVNFDLDVDTYNALRSTHVQSAQLLIVLVLAPTSSEWLDASEEELIVRKCAYWISLFGEPPVRNAATVRVRLPRTNIFGPDSLRDLMGRADAKARAGETGI